MFSLPDWGWGNVETSTLESVLAGLGITALIIGIIAIIIGILNLINVYHWGMTEHVTFEKSGVSKKTWFYNLVLVPFIASMVMLIPIIGWIVGAIIYIYFMVVVLIYFFGVRYKVNRRS